MEHQHGILGQPPLAQIADTTYSELRRDSIVPPAGLAYAPFPAAVINDRHLTSKVSSSTGFTERTLVGEETASKFDKESIQSYDQPITATLSRLEALEEAHTLPKKPRNRIIRYLRWNFFSVYRKIFATVFTINSIAIILVLVQLRHAKSGIPTYANAATAAAANICVGVLARNEHVVNALFRIACCLPHSFPLAIRRHAAKIYSYGGFHSSCGVSAGMWYIVYCGLLIYDFCHDGSVKIGLAVTTGIVLVLLLLIIIFAHPYLRMRFHDHFERIHRFAGWTTVAAFWVQTGLAASAMTDQGSAGEVLVKTPTFWFLIIITCCIVYPWIRLRRRKLHAEQLSMHATRLHFDYKNMETAMGVRLTDAPLKETHAFATIPNRADEKKGFSVVVSNAGDWTSRAIRNPPKRLWIRGAPVLGVIRVSLLFKKVLVIATGSGVGPCLSFLQSRPNYPARFIWSASNPVETFGDDIVQAVFQADPEALIVDTKKTGRGNLLALAYSVFKDSGAEATVIISNPKVTKKVVYGLESRGVPAYGAIFDS
ncbi:hypothetical protein BDV97DRAFT_364773 [Delphinella strobiligena]|nr:hypothetical protein BDV97DRAFT_364773 [Delphinella strobiligena]